MLNRMTKVKIINENKIRYILRPWKGKECRICDNNNNEHSYLRCYSCMKNENIREYVVGSEDNFHGTFIKIKDINIIEESKQNTNIYINLLNIVKGEEIIK